MKYWAFLSYSHADREWGDWLHKTLETYRVPRHLVGGESRDGEIPARVFPVFRDREELPVSADLGANIEEALRESRYLIVICSPRSAQSRWVGEEINVYKRLGRENRILALIVDGEPNASEGKPGYTEHDECFHAAMRYHLGADGQPSEIRAEPIAADAREGKDGRNNAKLKLLAGLLGVDYDELKQRDNERRLRRLRVVIAIVTVLLSIFGAVSVYAWLQKQAAQRARQQAESEKNRAETALQDTRRVMSRSDTLQALRFISDDKDFEALAHLVRSLSFDPKNDAALGRLTTLLTYRNYALPLYRVKMTGKVLARFSPDGKRIVAASWDDRGLEGGALLLDPGKITGELRILDARDGKALFEPRKLSGAIREIAFSPNATRLLTVSTSALTGRSETQLRIWSLETGQPLGEPIELGERHLVAARFNTDGTRIVAETAAKFEANDGRIHSSDEKLQEEWIWDAATGKLLSPALKYSDRGQSLRAICLESGGRASAA